MLKKDSEYKDIINKKDNEYKDIIADYMQQLSIEKAARVKAEYNNKFLQQENQIITLTKDSEINMLKQQKNN